MSLGKMGPHTQNPAIIDGGFPLCCPTWNYNSSEGREHLSLSLSLGSVGRSQRGGNMPTNLAKVRGPFKGQMSPLLPS